MAPTFILTLLLSGVTFAQAAPAADPVRVGAPEEPPRPPTAEEIVGMHYDEYLQVYQPTIATYSMSEQYNNYTSPMIESGAEWRAHAMQWKAHNNPGISFSIGQVDHSMSTFSGGLRVLPLCQPNIPASSYSEPAVLNHAEADSSVFASDPSGTWMCEVIPDPAVGAIFSALVMHHWGSPVYDNFYYQYPGQQCGTQADTAAFEKLNFTVPAGDLHAACGLSPNDPPSTVLGASFSCSAVAIDSVEVALWSFPQSCGTAPYVPYEYNRPMSSTSFISGYLIQSPRGNLVFDPPAEAAEEDIMGLYVLAEALAEQLVMVDANGAMIRVQDYAAELEVNDTQQP